MSLDALENRAVHQPSETGMSYADLLNNTDDDLLDHNFYLGRGGGVKNSRRPVFIKKPTPPVVSFLLWDLQVICLTVISLGFT